MMAQVKALVAKAKASPDGIAIERFESYPGHFSELIVRAKSGGGEVHAIDNDYFIVEEGQADVLVGGAIVDPKEVSPGETRGTKVEGGTSHHIGKGDLLHISPGVPHQTVVPAGKVFVYLVVKVAKPA
jgi:mannose-6-phosphate isomerase-like protein (cupin superfamily)